MKGTLLILFVLTQEAAQPETEAFTTAAREVLGTTAQVRVVAVPADLADLKVQEQAARDGADGAVELSWTNDRSRALVHCYVAGDGRWVDRSIGFGPDEDSNERGRMLGYAVASMFLSGPLQRAPQTPAPRAYREAPAHDDIPKTAAPSDGHAFDFGGLVSHGLGGEADALGVSTALSFSALPPLWLRAAVSGRGGRIPAAQATMKTLQASAGAAVELFDITGFGVGLRGDFIGSWLEVEQLSADDPSIARQQRWLFGVDTVACGALKLSAGASLFAGGGLEVMFGRTDIYTHGARVATIPPLRLIAEVGLRSEF